MRWFLLAMVLIVPLSANSQNNRAPDWAVFPLAHPDAKLLVGIDWRRILDSPLGPVLLKQIRQGGHPLLSFLDSIDNVDRLLLSTPGEKQGIRRPLLVIAEGRFLLSKIRKLAVADGAISRRYNDVELLVAPEAGNQDVHFALLDGNTILFGDGASVKAAIDRWQRMTGSHDRNPLFFRAVTLAAAHELWAVAEAPAEALAAFGFRLTELVQRVTQLELGATFSKAFNCSLLLKADSEEVAQTLASGVPALLQLLALIDEQRSVLAQLAQRIKVTAESARVRFSLALDGGLLESSLASLRSQSKLRSDAGAAQQRLASAIAPAGQKSAEPVRRVVRVIGAEDGNKEIPYPVGKP